jgi:hypothetical protein
VPRRRKGPSRKVREAADVMNPDMEMINSVVSLGRRLLPPVGAVLELVPIGAPDTGWRFKILSWEREAMAGTLENVPAPVTGLKVQFVPSSGAEPRGEHFLPLDTLERCEILELPPDAPNFLEWPTLMDVRGTVPARMSQHGAASQWTVAVEVPT